MQNGSTSTDLSTTTDNQDVDMLGNGYHDPSADRKIFVASVSPQVRASLAATYGISERKAGYMIEQFLSGPQGLRAGGNHGSGFSWVVDTNVMRETCLTLTTDEVNESGQGAKSPDSTEPAVPNKPILSSVCPGWICYAEKTHPHVLPHLSRLKSPQALTGTMLKTALSKSLNVPPSQIWHLAIMPCFDKKLEASREELTEDSWQTRTSTSQSPTRDVDCVITTREILMLASTRGVKLTDLPLKPLSSSHITPFPDQTLSEFLFSKRPSPSQDQSAGPSGGYLHHLLKTHESRNPGSTIHAQRGRNSDVVEYTLVSTSGEPILKAARYYGFRNIQNLVRKLKPARKSRLPGAKAAVGPRRTAASRQVGTSSTGPNTTAASDYAYVEVMACPGGCTNGGGQIRIEDARDINAPSPSSNPNPTSEEQEQEEEPQKPTPQEQRAWLARVDEAYFSADSDSDSEMDTTTTEPIRDFEKERENIHSLLSYWSRQTAVPLPKLVYTTFRKVESDVGKDKNGGGAGDMERVAQLAGKAGGGW